MCEFQSLYYEDDGYVVHCKDCGYYQVAFGNTMLSLSPDDYIALTKVVKRKHYNVDFSASENTRNVVIPTPSQGMYLLLTKNEATRLHEILEEADTEEKAQTLINLFNQ